MPTYDVECKVCKKRKEVFSSFKKLQESLNAGSIACEDCSNHDFIQVITRSPVLCDPVTIGQRKLPSGWNDVLQRIGSSNHKAQVDTSFSTKREV